MELLIFSLLLLLSILFSASHFFSTVVGPLPPGSLSLDCGLDQANESYVDSDGIEWQSDAAYISIGDTAQVLFPFSTPNDRLSSLRYFSWEVRSKYCYVIPGLTKGAYYMVRPSFFYGNYDNRNSVNITFSFLIDTLEWPWKLLGPYIWWTNEYYVVARGKSMDICLARTDANFDPFISSLEIRPLPSSLSSVDILNNTLASRNWARYDFGSRTRRKYPMDSLDRAWDAIVGTAPLNTNTHVNTTGSPNLIPSLVLETASNTSFPIDLNMQTSSTHKYFVGFYFAEIDPLVTQVGQRIFDIYYQSQSQKVYLCRNIDIMNEVGKNNVFAIETTLELSESVSFYFQSSGSLYGPFVSSMEIMKINDNPSPKGTLDTDASALEEVKNSMMLQSWAGEPCVPYAFNWLTCTSTIYEPRIKTLWGGSLTSKLIYLCNHLCNMGNVLLFCYIFNVCVFRSLSNQNLSGSLSPRLNSLTALESILLNGNILTKSIPDLSELKELKTLDLSNNKLDGTIPDWLADLPKLHVLSLENNNFTGRIPTRLLEKASVGNLTFSYDPPCQTCGESSKPNNALAIGETNKSNNTLAIGASVGSVVFLTSIIIVIWYICCKKRSSSTTTNRNNLPIKSAWSVNNNIDKESSAKYATSTSNDMQVHVNSTRQFSYQDIFNATNGFHLRYKIGEGGFGPVYLGTLVDGEVVAIKKLSNNYGQGPKEFLNEIALLSRIHHVNLVTLVGYCNEMELIIVYKYMTMGTLDDHLHGSRRNEMLDWKARVFIALGAAQGLDYLHRMCTPSIIHRDVKSSNILLDDQLCAKVSDFGISRSRHNQDTHHVTTTAMGTAGYADPEMINTQRVTEKSDVYSFGVLLLEILCGRRPIITPLLPKQANIVEWVRSHVERGELLQVVDTSLIALGSHINEGAMWKITEVALNCTQYESDKRPSMKDVVDELYGLVQMEFVEAPTIQI